MKRFICSVLACLFLAISYGQEKKHLLIPGEILVYLTPQTNPLDLLTDWYANTGYNGRATVLQNSTKRLGIRHNIHTFNHALEEADAQNLLRWLQQHPKIIAAQYNYTVDFRNRPNDERFGQQWDMEVTEAEKAWEITTGGSTTAGTPIVVAIMDSGFEIGHEDLNANLWHNPAEILGDGIDNDNNGYTDDDMGWDYFSDSPMIANGPHGTGCAGIIGAAGNNGIGVSGINWDIQMMLFSFSSVADLISAYEYAIDQRMRFNESNGQDGAFVVATNNSFGQSRIRCEQQPLWGAMYDLMGEVGILSSAGVANERYNVDISGDMPASCPSDYLLISCNTDENDNLADSSAFGEIAVDIGSPGEETITTRRPNTYGSFSLNSAATPHVTGAIALLYSAPCEGLEMSAIQQPSATALQVKEMITSGVDLIPSLTFRTQTGGRLNLFKALKQLEESCSNTLGDLQLSKLYPNPGQEMITAEFLTPENGTYYADLYNALGQLVIREKVEVGAVGIRTFELDVTNYSPGFYFLRFGQGDNWVVKQVAVY